MIPVIGGILFIIFIVGFCIACSDVRRMKEEDWERMEKELHEKHELKDKLIRRNLK